MKEEKISIVLILFLIIIFSLIATYFLTDNIHNKKTNELLKKQNYELKIKVKKLNDERLQLMTTKSN